MFSAIAKGKEISRLLRAAFGKLCIAWQEGYMYVAPQALKIFHFMSKDMMDSA